MDLPLEALECSCLDWKTAENYQHPFSFANKNDTHLLGSVGPIKFNWKTICFTFTQDEAVRIKSSTVGIIKDYLLLTCFLSVLGSWWAMVYFGFIQIWKPIKRKMLFTAIRLCFPCQMKALLQLHIHNECDAPPSLCRKSLCRRSCVWSRLRPCLSSPMGPILTALKSPRQHWFTTWENTCSGPRRPRAAAALWWITDDHLVSCAKALMCPVVQEVCRCFHQVKSTTS